MKDTDNSAPDPRRSAILMAAFECFRNYGYRRTSMEDIAKAAGMSRAALYSHFRNKEDVYRTLTEAYFDRAATAMQEALKPELEVTQALTAAFGTKTGPEIEAMLNSAHGDEFLDAHVSHCADIVKEGETKLIAVLGDWLDAEADAGRLRLWPQGHNGRQIATTMIAAVHGQKTPGVRYDALVANTRALAGLFGRALSINP